MTVEELLAAANALKNARNAALQVARHTGTSTADDGVVEGLGRRAKQAEDAAGAILLREHKAKLRER